MITCAYRKRVKPNNKICNYPETSYTIVYKTLASCGP